MGLIGKIPLSSIDGSSKRENKDVFLKCFCILMQIFNLEKNWHSLNFPEGDKFDYGSIQSTVNFALQRVQNQYKYTNSKLGDILCVYSEMSRLVALIDDEKTMTQFQSPVTELLSSPLWKSEIMTTFTETDIDSFTDPIRDALETRALTIAEKDNETNSYFQRVKYIFFSDEPKMKRIYSINNVQEFKFFVDLAHISAGESDMEVDRVMCMQSSVETSSLQEVEKINKTGVYKISNWGCSDEHIIRLSFQEVHEEETVRYANREYQKMLSEDDLKELKSKLALITKSSEANMEVEAFVHKIFRNMIVIFYCDESRKVKTEINLGNTGLISGEIPINLELPSLIQFFNDSYTAWEDHLHTVRSDEHIIRLSFQEVHEEETVRYANREYQRCCLRMISKNLNQNLLS